MSITKGVTYGSTEQITNTKLHNLVDNATISLEHDELANDVLTSLASTAGVLKTWSLYQGSLASGAAFRYDGANGIYGA